MQVRMTADGTALKVREAEPSPLTLHHLSPVSSACQSVSTLTVTVIMCGKGIVVNIDSKLPERIGKVQPDGGTVHLHLHERFLAGGDDLHFHPHREMKEEEHEREHKATSPKDGLE